MARKAHDTTFVIGDVHGHFDRLIALLTKAGFIGSDGKFTALTNTATVVQVGDFGHYGRDTRDGDHACWKFAAGLPWFRVLWGNHDLALFNRNHVFRGQDAPHPEVLTLIRQKNPSFALAREGHLITHAGLHPYWAAVGVDTPEIVSIMATLINLTCDSQDWVPMRDSIARFRGGSHAQGGIIWRDEREDILDIPQVYGHSRDWNMRVHGKARCIDIGEKDGDALMGIWLPSGRVVAVGSDAQQIESEHNG